MVCPKTLRRTLVPVIGVFLASWLSSCAGSLSRGEATTLIEDHLRSIAPDVLYPFILGIEVKEILRLDQNSREVRFDAVFKADPKFSGRHSTRPLLPDSTDLSAFLQRSDKGWTLVRYGEPMKNLIARLWHFQVRQQYVDLLETISALGIEATRWEGERVELLRSQQPGAWGEYLRGISEAELSRRVLMGDVRIPAGVQWGVLSAPNSQFYSVLWARPIGEPAVVCLRRIGSRAEDRQPPMEFSWMDLNARVMCKGRSMDFNPYTATREGLELIEKSGGILKPFRVG